MKLKVIVGQIILAAIAITLTLLSTSILFGQKLEKHSSDGYKASFCSNDWSSDDRAMARNIRELTLPSTGRLSVDGGRNGGIHIVGESRSDIKLRACVQAWGKSQAEADALAASTQIITAGTIRSDAAEGTNVSVTFDIAVPRDQDLELRAHNGGISIRSVEGTIDLETSNGGLHLDDLAGSVRGKTTNGGVHVNLTGNAWRGSGLELQTSNGGVHLTMSDKYAANFETGTVNGGFHSSIASVQIDREQLRLSKRYSASLNGGGAPVKITTTNGGVHIGADGDDDDND